MIANRRIFNTRTGRRENAVEWLQREVAAEKALGGFPGKTRIYVSSIGQFDQVVYEAEFESLAEYEEAWATWAARPTTPDRMKEWREFVKPGGTNEIWELVE